MKKSWTKNSHQVLEQATSLTRYNRWIISLFKKYFGKKVLEVGSGLGGLSLYIPGNITLSDRRSDYLKYLKTHLGHQTLNLDIEKDLPNDIKNSFDTLISSNIFEHLKNDQVALKNCFQLLHKNGKLLIFVPARPEIFGSLDRAMGHYRRYSKDELKKKAVKAGFEILKIKYVNFPGYFIWWLRGRLPAKSKTDNSMAKLFDILVTPFLYLEKYIPVSFGQSLMLVAKKP